MGKSRLVAEHAIEQTALSRVGLAAPIFLPAFIMLIMQRLRFYPQGKLLQFLLSQFLMFGELYLCVPLGCAIFPVNASVSYMEVEKEFQDLTDSNGKLIKKFYYNRGL